MSIEQEILAVLNQIPAAIEKAFMAIVEKHGTHDQKAHGRRHGVGGLREFAKKRGYQVRQVAGKGGKTEYAITNKKGDSLRAGGLTGARKLITSVTKERKRLSKKFNEEKKLLSSPIAQAASRGQSLSGFSEKQLRKTYLDLALKNMPHLTRRIDNELRARRGDFSNFTMDR